MASFVEGEELCGLMIRVVVRSPKERRDIDVNEAITVKQFKEQIAVDFSATVDQLCVIFAGKILYDTDRLKDCGVRDGTTLHLVIKSAVKEHTSADIPLNRAAMAAAQIDISATPFGLGEMGGLDGLSNLGMGSANFMDLQQSLQKEMFRNPALLVSVMDNPLVQHITSTPGMMHQLVSSNPQMRELMERNPEISEMLNNSELMSQTLAVARNPPMLKEMIRSHERAVNPGQALVSSEAMVKADRAEMAAGMKVGSSETAPQSTAQKLQSRAAAARAAAKGKAGSSMFTDAGVTSLMQQMMHNPQLMTNILQSPYMQSMMQYMTSNPQLMQQMISLNPMFSESEEIQEQIKQSIPYINQQLENTDVQGLMTNPRALQAIVQIQEGLQQLQAEAPGLVHNLGVAPHLTTPSAFVIDVDAPSPPPQPTGPSPYSQFIAHMMKNVSGANANLPENERYAMQMMQLSIMGFTNADTNLQALIATNGNVNAAIDELMQQQQQQSVRMS